jgi:N-glycosylase/DNA lyase
MDADVRRLESGAIPVTDLSGGVDLQATVECGQTYHWSREDGRMFEDQPATGGSAWYWTVHDGEFVRVRQRDGRLEWESTTDADPLLRKWLRLDDDLQAISERWPDDRMVREAYDVFEGLRIVRDPPFRTLVSFICSAQMRVSRIHAMVTGIAEQYGDPVRVPGPDGDPRTYHDCPAPETLAAATEADLRDLSLGYRAPYVARTAEMVADGTRPESARKMPYAEARDHLTEFVGVGQKVADCVLLFSLDHLKAVPLDTWIRTAIEEHYPDCAHGNYDDTSRAIRERFGGEHAGYVQTYVFYAMRTGKIES